MCETQIEQCEVWECDADTLPGSYSHRKCIKHHKVEIRGGVMDAGWRRTNIDDRATQLSQWMMEAILTQNDPEI